jgi:hypothetical protein
VAKPQDNPDSGQDHMGQKPSGCSQKDFWVHGGKDLMQWAGSASTKPTKLHCVLVEPNHKTDPSVYKVMWDYKPNGYKSFFGEGRQEQFFTDFL